MAKTDRVGNIIYYISIGVMVFKLVLNFSRLIDDPPMVDNALVAVALAGFLAKIATQRYTLPRLAGLIVLGALCLYTSLKADNFYLAMSFFAVAGFQDVPLKRCLRVMLTVKTVLLLIHFAAYWLVYFLRPGYFSPVPKNGLLMNTMYFGQANSFAMFVIWAVAEYYYIHWEQLNFRRVGLSLAVIAGMYLCTASRASLLSALAVVFGALTVRHGNAGLKRIFRAAARYGYALLSLFFVTASVSYMRLSGAGKELLVRLNAMLSDRIVLAALVDKMYGLTFLGNRVTYGEIPWDPVYRMNELFLDVGYLSVAFEFGLFYTLLLSFGFWYCAGRLEDKECFFIVIYLLFGCAESYISNAILCFPLLFIAGVIFKNGSPAPSGAETERRNRASAVGKGAGTA